MRSGLAVGSCLLVLTNLGKGFSVRYSTSWWFFEAVEIATLGIACILILSRFYKLQNEVRALSAEVEGLKNRLDKIAHIIQAGVTRSAERVVELVTQRG